MLLQGSSHGVLTRGDVRSRLEHSNGGVFYNSGLAADERHLDLQSKKCRSSNLPDFSELGIYLEEGNEVGREELAHGQEHKFAPVETEFVCQAHRIVQR